MTHATPRPFRAARSRRPKTPTVLRLEALEDRTLLSAAAPVSTAVPFAPNDILVQFRTSAPPSFNIPGAVLGQSLSLVPGLYEVNLNGLSVAKAVAAFQANPNVISAEPDYLVSEAGVPNDALFSQQWGLQNTGQNGGLAGVDVKAVQAWNITTSAKNVIVSLIDTGIDYDNVDLYQNIWINQAEIPNWWYTKSSDGTYDKVVYKSQIVTATPGVITFADLNNPINKGLVWDNNGDNRIDVGDLLRPFSQGGWDNNGNDTKDGDTAHPDDFFGWNFVANNNNPMDDNDHGTNVAGIIGAQGNNGINTAGLDWQVQMMAIKAFDANGFATISNIVAGIGYSIKHGAEISNNSWDYLSPSTTLQNAVAGAQAAGQIFVVAAGNYGNPEPDWPAAYSTQYNNIVAVAAIDRSGNLYSSSNYGATTVALGAPGVDIVSTAIGGGYSTYTGTSQATAFVTGVLALVWQEHPTWTYQQVIAQVLNTTTPLASLKGKTITGGLLNAAAAVGATANGGGQPVLPPPPHVLSAASSGPNAYSLNQIVLTFDQAINPTTVTAANISLLNPANQSIPLSFTLSANGLSLQINFALQGAGGNYTLKLGAGLHDQAGVALAPYTSISSVTAAPNTFTSTGPTPIPNQGTYTSSITVNESMTIGSVSVILNITDPTDDALVIHLQSPTGTDILLVNQRGGTGANFQNTILENNAPASIRFSAAPFLGAYQPETPLSTFNGQNAHGVWKLVVIDERTGNVGVVNSWSLTFTPPPPPTGNAGVSGEAVILANANKASTAGEVSGPPTIISPPMIQGNPQGTAALDAVFLAEEAKSNLRTSLLTAWPTVDATDSDGKTASLFGL